jgi:TRAP-type C4-dicarboxylate transport system permease large subunit
VLKINTLYTLILLFLLLTSLVAGIWVIYNLDPNVSVNNVFWFFLSSGVFVSTSIALLLYVFRQRFGVRELAHTHFTVSLRQGFLIGLCYIISLFLQSKGLFTWLNSIYLMVALIFLESFFIYNQRRSQ